jgi:glycosyltransferase involved in cell wall biosynthesis
MRQPLISAIICTHNRADYLGAAIDSLLRQDCEASDIPFEVLVVDNASTDHTREVVEARVVDRRLRYLYEPVTGLSVARNTGAKSARGQVLAYLDDDAEASPQWLRRLHEAFVDNDRLAIAGGRVTLLWPPGRSRPRWLSDGLTEPLGAYDLGDRAIAIRDPGQTPRGLNYALRRCFLDEVGGFDPSLGRVGTKLLSNEELMMTEQAIARGWQVGYVPDAHAAHNVAPERLQPRWFLKRAWWQGISECYREQLAGRAGIEQLWLALDRFSRGLYKALRYWRNPALCFDNLVYAYGQLGYLLATLRHFFGRSAL